MSAPVTRRQLLAVVCGNALEFYDFVTYAFFAVPIGRTFFPAGSEFASLMLSLTAFGVGFLGRPLGALFIGRHGDRVGRVPAMRLSLGLMGFGTAALITIPPYAMIGIAAPILVMLARVAQGFALGGEAGPATAFLIEAAPPGQRGRFGAWQVLSQNLASILAGLIGVVLASRLDPAALARWGWRLAFVPGLLVVPAGLWLRVRLRDRDAIATSVLGKRGFDRATWRTIGAGAMLAAAGTAATYALLYLTTYASVTLRLPGGIAFAAPLVIGLGTIAAGWPAALLSDRWGRKPIVLAGWTLLLVVAWPAFALMVARPSAATFLGGAALLTVCYAVAAVPSMVLFAERVPRSRRSVLIAIVYAVAVTIFGSLTQPFLAWSIARLDATAPAFLLMTCATIALVATCSMRRSDAVEMVGSDLEPDRFPFASS